VRTAVDHGRQVAAEVGRRMNGKWANHNGQAGEATAVLDLCIVGAGPAGLSCSLESRRLGLNFLTLDQEGLGGTVAKYPRRKLVMTQPMELPLGGKLKRTTYLKEELIKMWQDLCHQHQLPVQAGERLIEVSQQDGGTYVVRTEKGSYQARNVCLALGRRGTPRKLGVPGEELPKVTYSLLDAQAYQNRHILVVGGGDSAIEAALGLANQPGNQVHLSYRKENFFRLKARNEMHILEAMHEKTLRVHFSTQVKSIEADRVTLTSNGDDLEELTLQNDDVLVMVGGVPPFPLLSKSGISFDPQLHPPCPELAERGTGLVAALRLAFLFSLVLAVWFFFCEDYYQADPAARLEHPSHSWLRSSRGLGLAAGILAASCMAANLLYLVRRSQRLPFFWGSLKSWMTAHVGTGLFAMLLALMHGCFTPSQTVGGHATLGLFLLVITGAIGRYFYSFVPRAANGSELALEEVKASLLCNEDAWDSVHPGFKQEARQQIAELIVRTRWRSGLIGVITGLVLAQVDLGRTLRNLRQRGRSHGIPVASMQKVVALARRAHRNSLSASHLDDLRGLLSGWRYFHRWLALLVVLLVVVHIWSALRYAQWGGAA
jgi:dihydropyrimidine dehydrogenase (NAD+) subunit PreT